jgi:hypothetical protein
MKQKENDITELLFPLEDLTLEEKKRLELWGIATNEAGRLVGNASPIALMNKTKEIYKTYLQSQNLIYDEARGF